MSYVDFYCYDKTWTNNLEEDSVNLAYSFQSYSHTREVRAGTCRQELKQRPWKDAAYCLALHCWLSYLLYTALDHLPRGGTAHSGLHPPTPIINQEKALTDLPISQSDGGIFSIDVLASKMTLTRPGMVVHAFNAST